MLYHYFPLGISRAQSNLLRTFARLDLPIWAHFFPYTETLPKILVRYCSYLIPSRLVLAQVEEAVDNWVHHRVGASEYIQAPLDPLVDRVKGVLVDEKPGKGPEFTDHFNLRPRRLTGNESVLQSPRL